MTLRPSRTVLLVWSLLLAACRASPHDVFFAGDSNTKFLPCSYPNQWQAMHDPVAVRTYNDAIFGSQASTWLTDGWLLKGLEDRQPTDVVIALGTNDIMVLRRSGWVVATDLLALYRQAERFTRQDGGHPRVFLATIPPVYQPPDTKGWMFSAADIAAFDVQIHAANGFIRMKVPPDHVLDFDTWMPASWAEGFLASEHDGVHVGCDAHTVRAQKVEAAIS